MGPPKLEYPTHSPSLKQEQFLLQANTETFMTFSIEKETFQKKRGLFQSKIYCEDDIQNYEAVNCYKKCFIRSLQVSCIPEAINTFDGLNMSVCNENEEQSNMEKLFGEESLIPQFRCDCLDPCVQLKYRFQVKRKTDLPSSSNSTILRINGETFTVKEINEHMEYNMYALMTSIGGYLGLFIGLSLGDVCISVVDAVVKFFTSTSKHRG